MRVKKALVATLSIVLCLSTILGIALPLLLSMSPTAHADEVHTVRIEAENAYWNGYQLTKSSTVSPYPTVIGNAASTHTYATWSELSALKLNKNIHIYVAFCVDVPKAGTYKISTGNVIRMSANSTPYAAIVVNPQYNGKAYQLSYGSVDTNAKHCVSKAVEVQLQKGRNMIYMTPFTSNQSINWADADYIEITGDYAVKHISPSAATTVAANAGGVHKFNTISADALAGSDLTQVKGLTAASITRADLSSVPHATYTVTAPADGYYDISLKFGCSSSINTSNYAFALLVDNRPAEVKPIYATGNSTADISTYLTKGTHVLTIPVILPKTDSTKTVYWTDLKGLTMNDGLTLSDQFNSLAMGTLLETETYAFAWRYPNVYENSERLLVGGSQPGLVKQTYAELAGGAKLDKNQPMFTYQVDVLAAGEYTLNVSYRDYTGSDYYMIVSIDDTTFTKAVYTGDDPNYTNRRIATATLNLTEGRHFIRLITLPGDSQVNWIDVDYAALKGSCPVIGIKDWMHLQSANTISNGFTGTTGNHSAYGSWWLNALSGYQGNSMANNAGVTTENFKPADLANMGWIKYNVHVPRDGYYDMQTYLQPDPKSSGTGKILLGIEKIDANLINQAQGVLALNYTGDSSGWWDIEGDYDSFCVTAKNYLPMADSAEGLGQTGYSMVLRVTMDNGQFYAFRITNDESVRYAYSRYGANGSASGWGEQKWVDGTTTTLINTIGAKFKVERTNGNTLTITLNGKVLDTFTMEGVTKTNKVVSVGFRQCGNPASEDYQVEVPFELPPSNDRVDIDIPGIENGTVTTEKDGYKVGDTVVLNVTPEPGFSQKLTLNGKPILLDWNTGKFSFTATDEVYDIDGSFERIYWNNTTYRWVDVRLDEGAKAWWLADLSSYLTEGDYVITVSGLMDYTGSSYDWCDMGALTVSGGITLAGARKEETLTNVVTKLDKPGSLFYRNDNITNDLPDPFVLDNTARDGYYYIYGTWGAFRCFRSKNLMDWELCGEVLQQYREQNKVWDSAQGKYSYQVLGSDLWAPEVVYDEDTKLYYMFFSATPDLKNQATTGSAAQLLMVATATSPTGPFNLVNFKSSSSCGAGNTHNYSTSTYSDYFAPYLLLDPAKHRAFSEKINNEWRGATNGGYVASIDAHPYVAPDGTKYLYWVDNWGPDRICGVEMENWLKPKWETAQVLVAHNYYTIADWKNGSSNKATYETPTTTNEGPFVIEHNGKYYLTYSIGNWKNNTYQVAQAIANSPLGPYTKLKESEGAIMLSSSKQGSQTSSGTGHHSMLQVGKQLFIIYHRHSDLSVLGAKRNHAVDEVKWINVGGREIMYVNGPNTTLQPKVEKYGAYHNIAGEATLTGSSSANLKYLNDGLLSHLKNGPSAVTNVAGETKITSTSTFTFDFSEARSVTSIMVYNSRLESQIFRKITQVKLVCVENGETVVKYINDIPFNTEYYQTDSNGKVTYVEPCSAAYAVFGELQVLSVEITVEVPAGQSSVSISEIRILGK